MAQSITFTGATIKSFSRDMAKGKINFRSNLTDGVSRAMGWGKKDDNGKVVDIDLPEYSSKLALDGELAAQSMILTPADSEMKKLEIDTEIQSVSNFEAVRQELKGSRGKGKRIELHFTVSFAGKDTAALLEHYLIRVGEGKGTLKVSYAKQMALDEDAAEDETTE